MSKAATIAVLCGGLGTADLLCIDAWLLPAVVVGRPHATATAGPTAAASLLGAAQRGDATATMGASPSAGVASTAVPSMETSTVSRPTTGTPSQPTVAMPAVDAPKLAAVVPAEEEEPTIEAAPAVVATSLQIHFARTGAAVLDARARASVDALARKLRHERGAKVRVDGHADARGSDDSNERLSRKRAQAVARRLQRDGVALRRIEVAWSGERKPAVVGDGDAAWAANRRVELQIDGGE